jgi:hypothetical protein
MTGFLPTAALTYTNPSDFVIEDGPRSWASRLRHEGFRAAVLMHLVYAPDVTIGAGLSLVIEFGSSRAAHAELRAEYRDDVSSFRLRYTFRRFAIAGIPGAAAYSLTDHTHPGGGANILFTEGSCLLFVGDEDPKSNYTTPAIAGARSIYRHTRGRCPASGPGPALSSDSAAGA